MSAPLRKFFARSLAGVLIASCSPLALAASPLMLRVTKLEGTAIKSRYQSGSYTSKSGADTVQYSIDLINGATNALSNVTVHWVVLVRAYRQGESDQIVEGEHQYNLDRGEKVTLETDILELGRFYRNSYSGTDRNVHAEIQGYYVEVTVDGQPATANSKPPDIKRKIDSVRAAKAPKEKGGQKIHNF